MGYNRYMRIEVYSDGSATTSDKPGGYGWVMVINGKKESEGNGHMEFASNNDAELEAAIQGLKAVYVFIDKHFKVVSAAPDLSITLVSDSQLILGWADGTYKFKQASKMDKFHELQALVGKLRVKTRWVRGHNGDEHNERCDMLANEARTGIENKKKREEALAGGKTNIGHKKTGIVCIWYKDKLKVIDLDTNIMEDYDREVHGARGSALQIREEKSR